MHPQINPWLLYEQMDMKAFEPVFQDLVSRDHLFVYESDGQMAGMCKLAPMKYRNSHIMYLGGVAVDPDWAGKGIAADMLRRAIALTREKGYARIELTVATINHRAIRLYEQLGFETEGVLKDYTYLASEERYIDEQVMALLLR